MPQSLARKLALLGMILVTTGAATWISFELVVRSELGAESEALVASDATALELKWSAKGVGDRFSPLPDPLVDMTFLPGLDGVPTWKTGVPLTTNAAGFRYPRDFEPKSPGTFRVVVLGDSFVASAGGRFEDGAGPQLEGMLRRAAPPDAPNIEVYPLGIGGWNVVSQVNYLIHNLHRFAPDVVVHVLNTNDLDSGFGFVLGNHRSSTYDSQRVFGNTYYSIASPRKTQGRRKIKGLLGSYLIPESKRRYEIAARQIGRLQDLLDRHLEAPYLVYVLTPTMTYGLGEVLAGVVPDERILVAPPDVRANTLAPLNGHPNREGYRYMALSLAHALHERGFLALDRARLEDEGDYAPYRTLAESRHDRVSVLESYEVDRIPASVRAGNGRLRPPDAARSIVGGFYRANGLSPHATLVLRRPKEATQAEVTISFPSKPALDGGTMTVRIDQEVEQTLPMRAGVHVVRIPLPSPSASGDLVEITLQSDRYYTEPEHGMVDGVFGYAPKSGFLLGAEVKGGAVD